ncbi:structural protein [Cellulophaga phage phi48:2]|uniref:structural protein n=1 Tax=Cellulophaga phage phi48:2 TaxID=1327968 RepID=UPI00035193F4|nr:structural protein [Cellulophaga phage phi48:2]AGO47256.1 structural protein [Cellulophaga phage phi48:2]
MDKPIRIYIENPITIELINSLKSFLNISTNPKLILFLINSYNSENNKHLKLKNDYENLKNQNLILKREIRKLTKNK